MKESKSKSIIYVRLMKKIKERKSLFILLFILQMLGIPVITITMQILCTHNEYSSYSFSVFLLVPCLFFSAASIAGIFCSISSFRYLHSKCRADSELSLPMSSTQRFISDFFSGLIIYIIPYITAAVSSLLIVIFSAKTNRNPVLFDNYTISNILMREIMRFLKSDILEIIYILFCGLLIMLMLYTLTSFITVCCGNIIECVLYTVVSNVFIPLLAYTCTTIFSSNIPYINYNLRITSINIDSQSVNIVSATSPLGGIVMIISRLKNYYNPERLIPTPSYWVLKYSIVLLVIFTLTFLLYKKRKAEDISKPFAFSFAYYLFTAPVIMTAFGFFFRNQLIFASVIVSLFAFAAMYLIRFRGIKKNNFIKSTTFYTVSVVLSFILIKSYESYNISQMKKIPDLSDISSVTVTLPIEYDYYKPFYHPLVTFTDSENIQTAMNMDRISADEDNTRDAFSQLQILYTLKNGKKIYKEISITQNDYSKKGKEFLNNEQTPDILAKTISSSLNWYNKTLHIISEDYFMTSESMTFSNEQINLISDSLKKDIVNTASDNIFSGYAYFVINNCYYIPKEFTNTIKVFKDIGYIKN